MFDDGAVETSSAGSELRSARRVERSLIGGCCSHASVAFTSPQGYAHRWKTRHIAGLVWRAVTLGLGITPCARAKSCEDPRRTCGGFACSVQRLCAEFAESVPAIVGATAELEESLRGEYDAMEADLRDIELDRVRQLFNEVVGPSPLAERLSTFTRFRAKGCMRLGLGI